MPNPIKSEGFAGRARAYDPNTRGAPGSHQHVPKWPGRIWAASEMDSRRVSVQDNTDGRPSPPCERQSRVGVLVFPLKAFAGAQEFKIWVRHPNFTPYPRVIIKANAAIGLSADVEAVAVAGTDWQELVAPFTTATTGVVEVWREVRAPRAEAFAKWDLASLEATP